MTAEINIPAPDLQIAFSFDLAQIRRVYLQDALSNTINDLDLTTLDLQLKEYVPQDSLKILAKRGLRGELVFPIPCILETNPFMLGYYRLLLGFSKKEF
ncbi:MAG: XcyI family restriction endonuclease, partial [Proteobacteria bacterium]|nr:XcyI family restriction endonuclease [Pseudomonadota bacterium]